MYTHAYPIITSRFCGFFYRWRIVFQLYILAPIFSCLTSKYKIHLYVSTFMCTESESLILKSQYIFIILLVFSVNTYCTLIVDDS